MSEIDYKERCEQYEKVLGIGQHDPVKNAFFVLVKMMNDQSNYLNNFSIVSHIDNNDKESPQYKRAMDMLDSLPKMIASVNELRATLKLNKDDMIKMELAKTAFSKITTPESMADNIGELAGGKK
jgi:hypothetical protein